MPHKNNSSDSNKSFTHTFHTVLCDAIPKYVFPFFSLFMIALNSPDCLLSPQLVSVWYFCHIRVIQFSTGSYTGEVQIVQCILTGIRLLSVRQKKEHIL